MRRKRQQDAGSLQRHRKPKRKCGRKVAARRRFPFARIREVPSFDTGTMIPGSAYCSAEALASPAAKSSTRVAPRRFALAWSAESCAKRSNAMLDRDRRSPEPTMRGCSVGTCRR